MYIHLGRDYVLNEMLKYPIGTARGKYSMYIHLGRDYVLNDRDIIGIFNLETTTVSPRGREFLNYAQKNGAVVSLSDDLPQCYVLADAPVDTVYLSELSSAAMKRRTEMPF